MMELLGGGQRLLSHQLELHDMVVLLIVGLGVGFVEHEGMWISGRLVVFGA